MFKKRRKPTLEDLMQQLIVAEKVKRDAETELEFVQKKLQSAKNTYQKAYTREFGRDQNFDFNSFETSDHYSEALQNLSYMEGTYSKSLRVYRKAVKIYDKLKKKIEKLQEDAQPGQ